MPSYAADYDRRSEPATYLWFSVITTNAGNMEYKLPACESNWTATDRRKFRELERFAERIGTYIGRSSYRRL